MAQLLVFLSIPVVKCQEFLHFINWFIWHSLWQPELSLFSITSLSFSMLWQAYYISRNQFTFYCHSSALALTTNTISPAFVVSFCTLRSVASLFLQSSVWFWMEGGCSFKRGFHQTVTSLSNFNRINLNCQGSFDCHHKNVWLVLIIY